MTGEIIPLELLSKGDPGLDEQEIETALAENDGNIGKIAKQLGSLPQGLESSSP